VVGRYILTSQAIKNGTAKPCFSVDLVWAQDELGFSDALAGYISGSLLEAGSDTTAATLVGCKPFPSQFPYHHPQAYISAVMQAMVLFPAVATTAQEEWDRVCGSRMPTLDDMPNLPYIRACVKESLRWMPTDILGVPHAVIREDEYMGYTIPKGAGVMWTSFSPIPTNSSPTFQSALP
jgi:cytochrome P450